MFLVTNTYKEILVISDLGLTIEPRQAFDLDTMSLKNSYSQSKDLKGCIKKGWIKVLKTDHTDKRRVVNKTEIHKHNNNIDKKDIDQIKDSVKDEIKNQLSLLKNEQDKKNDQNELLLGELLTAINGLAISNKNKEVVYITQDDKINEKEAESFDYVEEIDEDILNEIHTKVMSKKTKNVQGTIEHKKKNIKSNIVGQVSELEDLLD